MQKHPLIACVVVAAVACSGAAVRATTLLPSDLGELSRNARVIARGRIAALDAQWTDDHRAIETLVTLQADAYLKGPLGSTLQFRVPGGRLGRFQSITIGAPRFAVGDHVIVFLGARAPGLPYVLGLSQGVFRLAQSGANWLVTPPAVVATGGGPTPIVRGDPARRPMLLADFERQVRTLGGAAR